MASNTFRREQMTKAIAEIHSGAISPYTSMSNFEDAQRVARALASSDMVPDAYRKRVDNCLVAMEMANRCNISVLAAMQNLHVIHGKPSWSSQYLIAAINTCGRFKT